jgi:hypothetical protein
MSQRLANANTLQFKARVQADSTSLDGVTVIYTSQTEFALQRPNKLAAIRTGEGDPTEIIYDGKQLVGITANSPVVAVSDAPDNIDDMAKFAFEKAGLYFPGGVVLLADSYPALTADLKAAFIVGKTSLVGGVETDAVALAGTGVDGQFWIGSKDKLPRMITMIYTKQPNRPQVTIEFTDWSVDKKINPSRFDTSKFIKMPKTEFARHDQSEK